MNMNVQSHRRRPTLTCKGVSSAEHFYHSIRYCVWLSTTTNLSYRKQYALLRSTGVRVGGGRVHGAPQPRHWGGAVPPGSAAYVSITLLSWFQYKLNCDSGCYVEMRYKYQQSIGIVSWLCGIPEPTVLYRLIRFSKLSLPVLDQTGGVGLVHIPVICLVDLSKLK